MRINKEFAPITIVLETKEDRNTMLNILEAAYRKRTEVHLFRTTLDTDDLLSKIQHMREKLQ